MANTPEIDTSQGRVITVLRRSSDGIDMPQGRVQSVINFPTPEMKSTQAQVRVIGNSSNPMLASQGWVLAIARGRTDDFSARAWTFTLDGHDFYVLHLGQMGTIVYDVLTGQWMGWDSIRDIVNWKANTGINWNSRINNAYGSDVVVGDDLTGMLYYLDPSQPYDGSSTDITSTDKNKFTRTLVGGIPARGRGNSQVNFAFLTVSLGMPLDGSQTWLRTSDDLGKTWQDHGYITVDPDNWTQDATWFSLGSFGAPGRIFEINDDGAFERVDSLDVS